MNPYNLLRYFWEILLIITYSSNLKGETSSRPFQDGQPQQDPVGKNPSFLNQKIIITSRPNHKKEEKGKPAFPLKHHRFKVNMCLYQENPPQYSNPIMTITSNSNSKQKKEGRRDPASPQKRDQFKQGATSLYSIVPTLPRRKISQNSECGYTLHYQKSALIQLEHTSYHRQSSASLELSRRKKPPPTKHPPRIYPQLRRAPRELPESVQRVLS